MSIFEPMLLGLIPGHMMINVEYKKSLISRLRTIIDIDDIQDYLPIELLSLNDLRNKHIIIENEPTGIPVFLFLTRFIPPNTHQPQKAAFLINIQTGDVFLFQLNAPRSYFNNTIIFGYFSIKTFVAHDCIVFENMRVNGAPMDWSNIVSTLIVNELNDKSKQNLLTCKISQVFPCMYDDLRPFIDYLKFASNTILVCVEYGPSRYILNKHNYIKEIQEYLLCQY